MSVSLLIVEDQPVVLLGLEALLTQAGIKIVGTATTMAQALSLGISTKADVVLLDIRLPDGDGLSALARIKGERPELPVLIYSGYDNPAFGARAVALGAAGYLLKGASKDELVTAIQRAASGESLWTRDELRRVSSSLSPPRNSYDIDFPLTRREIEVLTRIVSGHTNKRIADELTISYETVKEHVQHLLKKIGVSDRTQAAVWAVRTGILEQA